MKSYHAPTLDESSATTNHLRDVTPPRLAALILVLCLLATACKKAGNEMVGTWHSARGAAITDYHFFPDGTFTTQFQQESLVAQTKGTYSTDGQTLTMANSEAEVHGPEPAATSFKQKLLEPGTANMRRNSPFNIQLEIPGSNEPLILQRVSEKP